MAGTTTGETESGRKTENMVGQEHSLTGSNASKGKAASNFTSHLAYAARLWRDLSEELCISIINYKRLLGAVLIVEGMRIEACLLCSLGTWWLDFCFIKKIDGQCGLVVLSSW